MASPAILLIEHNEDDANQMDRILRKYRIANRLAVYPTGDKALSAMEGVSVERVELVLLDCSLTDKPARDVAIRLRGLPGLETVPVIVCCGTPDEEQQVKQWGIPRVISMSKPAGFFKILECIQKLEMHWQVFGAKP